MEKRIRKLEENKCKKKVINVEKIIKNKKGGRMRYFSSLNLSKKLKEAGCGLIQPCEQNKFCYDKPCWYKVFKGSDEKNFKIELGEEGSPYYNEDYDLSPEVIVPAYDILWDICVRYTKEFFGEEAGCPYCFSKNYEIQKRKGFNYCNHCNKDFIYISHSHQYHSEKILLMLQQNRPQKEIEVYIWDNCKFNPKNKEKK